MAKAPPGGARGQANRIPPARSAVRIAAGIEYNGTGFKGWQRQVGVRTVQECVEQALSRVADHDVTVVTAGRTDCGVHATGQVVHFDSLNLRSDYAWVRGTNSALPPDIRVLWVRPVSGDFHARFAAIERSYRYVILNRPVRPAVWHRLAAWEYRPLAVQLMHEAAQCLLGSHDFSAFRAAGCQARSPCRTITRVEAARSGDWIWVDVDADAFLQHMVRNIVGMLMAIGRGEQAVTWSDAVLRGRDRTRGGVTAPPEGLYLSGVRYPERYQLPCSQPAARFW